MQQVPGHEHSNLPYLAFRVYIRQPLDVRTCLKSLEIVAIHFVEKILYHDLTPNRILHSQEWASNFPQRDFAALRAISLRCLAVSFLARACPPSLPRDIAARFLPLSIRCLESLATILAPLSKPPGDFGFRFRDLPFQVANDPCLILNAEDQRVDLPTLVAALV